MSGKGGNIDRSNAAKLEDHISCIKYSIFCFNIIGWVSLKVKFKVENEHFKATTGSKENCDFYFEI